MDTKFLILWLEAPLQSYGEENCLYVRSTTKFPRRAALWGMIFGAAGWYNEQRDRLAQLRPCSLTVFGYGKEKPILSDFHIVGGGWDESDPWQERMVPHTSNGSKVVGIPTRPRVKQYLQDSVFSAICEFPAQWEDELRETCKSPKDVVFLGRKACIPTVPVLQGIADDWDQALRTLSFVEEQRNKMAASPVMRTVVFEETKDQRQARWHLQDVPLAFRPSYEYVWRYVAVRHL